MGAQSKTHQPASSSYTESNKTLGPCPTIRTNKEKEAYNDKKIFHIEEKEVWKHVADLTKVIYTFTQGRFEIIGTKSYLENP